MQLTKKIPILPGMKMQEIIFQNHYILLMLEHFGISLVVYDKTIKELCDENQISTGVFLAFANLYNGVKYTPEHDYDYDDLQTIIRYLKNCHVYYLKEKCPKIEHYIRLMCEQNDQPETQMVKSFFKDYLNEITEHLNYEDEIVFPYIIDLYQKIKGQATAGTDNNYSVTEYKEHHNDIEEKLNDIKNILIRYLPQKEDPVIRRKLLFSLFEMESDLNVHSHIEDSILIPLVEKMERQLQQI